VLYAGFRPVTASQTPRRSGSKHLRAEYQVITVGSACGSLRRASLRGLNVRASLTLCQGKSRSLSSPDRRQAVAATQQCMERQHIDSSRRKTRLTNTWRESQMMLTHPDITCSDTHSTGNRKKLSGLRSTFMCKDIAF
jgi:hypothetical protein